VLDSGLRGFDNLGNLFNHYRFRRLALLNLFSDLDHLVGEGLNLFFAVRWLFRFYNRGGFDRRLRLGRLFNGLLLFGLLLFFLLFFTEA
jgi:hypothetical protein